MSLLINWKKSKGNIGWRASDDELIELTLDTINEENLEIEIEEERLLSSSLIFGLGISFPPTTHIFNTHLQKFDSIEAPAHKEKQTKLFLRRLRQLVAEEKRKAV